MNIKIGIGVSLKLDSFAAGKEAARSALYNLGKYDADIFIAFISPIFNQKEAIKGIYSIGSKTPLIGCSTLCSITDIGSFRNAVTVCAISSKDIRFSLGIGNNISRNSRLAGSEAAKQSIKLKNTTRQIYIMFPDCLSGNMADVLRGTQETLGTSFPIIGGPATDNVEFQKTYQYLNNNIFTDSVVGLLISGNMNVGMGSAHSWQPIGRPHQITKARSNIIKEIDRKKAIDLYREYLGKTLDEIKAEGIAKLGVCYPLGMQMGAKKGYIIRAPFKMEDNGSLMLGAELPEHTDINLMMGDRNLTSEATKMACREALKTTKKPKIKFAIVFSDIGRFQLLRKDLQNEVKIIKDLLGEDVRFFGCYTCGAYAPIGLQAQEYIGQSHFQNQIISVTVISE